MLLQWHRNFSVDEPTAGLDPAGSAEIYQFLLNLEKKEIVPLSSFRHTMRIANFCDKVAVMDHGKLVW